MSTTTTARPTTTAWLATALTWLFWTLTVFAAFAAGYRCSERRGELARPQKTTQQEIEELSVSFSERLEREVRPLEDPARRDAALCDWNAERKEAVRDVYRRRGERLPLWLDERALPPDEKDREP